MRRSARAHRDPREEAPSCLVAVIGRCLKAQYDDVLAAPIPPGLAVLVANSNPRTHALSAARTSFLTKCKRETCALKAVGSNGKPLKGAAKNSFMAKCEREQG